MLDFPVLSVGIDAVGPEGLDRPSTGVRTAVEAKFDKDGKFDKEGKRCADAQPHMHSTAHTQPLSLLTCKCVVVYAALIVSPPLAAPESNLGDRSTSSGT